MNKKLILKISGGFAFLFFLFHIPFHWVLNWEETLACLNRDNWAIMQTFSIVCTAMFFFFAYINFILPSELITTKLGKTALIFQIAVYTTRILAEFVFFDEPLSVKLIIIATCGTPLILNALALRITKNQQQ